MSTLKYEKEYPELFGFTEIKVLNICVHPNFIENKKGTILYQRETENQSWQLPVHVLFLITVEVFMVCLWTSKDVACYNCRHWFYEGVWGWNPQKIKCVYNTFSDCMYTSRKRFVCTNPLWDSSVCTNPLLAIFKTPKMT